MQEGATYQYRRAGKSNVCDKDVNGLHRRVVHAIIPDVKGQLQFGALKR